MRRAVVLFNLGGPSSLEDVVPFLRSLFSDPAILPYPAWIRKILASMIAAKRKKKAEDIYRQLGGKSPLLKNTLLQAKALEKKLGKDYKIFVAMRHAKPFIADIVAEIKNYRPHEVILLPLYPQFSTTTTKSSFLEWTRQDRLQKLARPQYRICCYPEMPGFIEAIARLTVKKLGLFLKKPRILFSAHGLPLRIIKEGDPYRHQIETTFKKVVHKIKELTGDTLDSVLCYQSRIGRGRWTEPSLDEEIERAARDQETVLVVPLSFTNEHVETLVELDIDYRERAQLLGISEYHRVPTVGCHPAFIQGLAQLVRTKENAPVSCAVGWKKCWRR